MAWVQKAGGDVYDVLIVLGCAAVLFGVAHWSAPAAWVLGGIGLIGAGAWPDVRKAKR